MSNIIDNLFAREEGKSGMVPDLFRIILGKLGQQKDVLVDVLAREIKTFLAKVNISDELKKALQGMTVNLNASFDFHEKGSAPAAKKSSRPRRKRRSGS